MLKIAPKQTKYFVKIDNFHNMADAGPILKEHTVKIFAINDSGDLKFLQDALKF